MLSGAALAVVSCATSTGETDRRRATYDLAHNTERIHIIQEAIAVLQLHDFTIEYADTTRNRSAVQTYWRMSKTMVPLGANNEEAWLRDRAVLNISPRGRSTVYQRAYLMVNATLQFEVEQRVGSSTWQRIPPPPERLKLYESIVKEIRNRMLKYHYEM